jgi:hypothetical protein
MKPLFPAKPKPPADSGGGGGGGFPAPQGIPDLHSMIGERSPIEQGNIIGSPEPSTGGFAVLDDRVICSDCANCWQIRTFAPVKNLREDGTPFEHREAYCLSLSPTAIVTLEQRYVFECNRFVPTEAKETK